MSIQALFSFFIRLRADQRSAWRELFIKALKIGLIAAIILASLYIFGKPFLIRVIKTNFNLLYISYANDPVEVFRYFADSFGWITWILAFLGYSSVLIK